MDHDEKYKEEIITRLEALCPNAREPQRIVEENGKENERFFRISALRNQYLSMNKVLIEEEFKTKNWSPIPELRGDLAYLAALNRVAEETRDD